MAAKQYATEQPMDHWRNQSGNKKNTKTNGEKAQWSKIYGMQEKQF